MKTYRIVRIMPLSLKVRDRATVEAKTQNGALRAYGIVGPVRKGCAKSRKGHIIAAIEA